MNQIKSSEIRSLDNDQSHDKMDQTYVKEKSLDMSPTLMTTLSKKSIKQVVLNFGTPTKMQDEGINVNEQEIPGVTEENSKSR